MKDGPTIKKEPAMKDGPTIKEERAMNDGALQSFKTLVKQRCGLSFDGVSEQTLVAALAERMRATHSPDPHSYYQRLAPADPEFDDLVALLTINETYFFREADQLRLLVDKLVPRRLAASPVGQPLRILSAGSSTGQEPYSIAMALMEKYGPNVPALFMLAGGDINRQALAKAEAGRYGNFSFRGVAPELVSRYFRPCGGGAFELSEQIRSLVEFHYLNLLAEEFPEALGDMDFVFWRNVSIYFDAPARRAIQTKLARYMRDGAVLFVGNAETMANDFGIFSLTEENGLFYFLKNPAAKKKRVAAAPVPAAIPAPTPKPSVPAADPVPASSVPPAKDDIRELVRAQRWSEAQALLGKTGQAENPANRLLLSWVRLQTGDYAGSEALARQIQTDDIWSAEASLLLGLGAKGRQEWDGALKWLKRVIYTKPACWVAHYYLGELYRALGDAEAARRAYRTALQQLSQNPDADAGLSLPLGLPLAEIRFLCERHAAPAKTGG